MTGKRKTCLLAIAPLGAVLVLIGTYAGLRGQLPERIVRHVGPDGAGFGEVFPVLAVILGLALACFAVGAWTCLDFLSLGHWYPGPKAIVVCFQSAGYALVGLGLATLLSAGAQQPATTVGIGLLSFVVAFAAAAGLLSRALPPARAETLTGSS